ncbi:MAG: hypothetical protein AAB641_00805 [Patescibacteria group bacterium]
MARNSAAAESEGGQKFLPPKLPFLPAPPDLSAKVSTAAERFGFYRAALHRQGFGGQAGAASFGIAFPPSLKSFGRVGKKGSSGVQ